VNLNCVVSINSLSLLDFRY